MTKKTAVLEPRHPKGVKLSDALKEDAPRLKAMKGLIDKKATLVKAADDPAVAAELATPDNMRPTDEQLSRINQYTRSAKTADEVAAFKTLSCNDIVDRDDDQFSTQCVKDFAQLPEPFSPTGKSFMLDHEYSTKNQIGRIFGSESKKVSGSQFLLNEVYVPNTPANQDYLTNVDFGVHWAVSVGVVLGKSECTVCKAPFGSYGWWCANGHDKGAYYDPTSEETDSWGYPLPCDSSVKGAIKCIRVFDDPKDMYELSQVFLGAQYFAALDKDPAFKSVVKAMKGNVPIIGLKESEARKLPLTHEPEKVSEARLRFSVETADDGSLTWTDDTGVRYSFDPSEPGEGIWSLGKASTDNNHESEEDDEDGNRSNRQAREGDVRSKELASQRQQADDDKREAGTGDVGEGSGEGLDGSDGERGEVGDQQLGVEGGSGTLNADASDDDDDEEEEDSDEESEDSEDDDEDSEEDDDEEKGVSKKTIMAAAKRAGLSDSALKSVRNAKGSGLSVLLNVLTEERKVMKARFEVLAPKAVLGDEYVEVLKAEAIDWYVKAKTTKETPKVKTEAFDKKLSAFGSNVELLRAEIEEQKSTAQERFPRQVRRSSFQDDPNSKPKPGNSKAADDEEESVSDEDGTFNARVKRIHG